MSRIIKSAPAFFTHHQRRRDRERGKEGEKRKTRGDFKGGAEPSPKLRRRSLLRNKIVARCKRLNVKVAGSLTLSKYQTSKIDKAICSFTINA